MRDVEDGLSLQIDFKKLKAVGVLDEDVIPVVVQDASSLEVLIVGYTNEGAFLETLRSRHVTFWSTSRNEWWVKGATSGDFLHVEEVRVNCEQNTLLYLVRPIQKGACHVRLKTGQTRRSCFYRSVDLTSTNLVDLGF